MKLEEMSGAASAIGSLITSGQNFSAANKARGFNAREGEKARQFAREVGMSKHRWEIMDLKAAGLNPMLSAMGGGGGVSAPSPAATTQQEVSDPTEGLSTALEARRLRKDIEVAEAQKKQINEQTKKTKTEKTLLQKEIPKKEAGKQLWEEALSSIVETKKSMDRALHSAKQKKKMNNRIKKFKGKPFPTEFLK
jgi:site-specific DNA-cytosine methylase